jgi:hypothetical protein
MRIELRCKGKKCPKKLRKGKVRRVSVTKSGTRSLTKLFKKARLRPKAVVDVRVFRPGAIARVDKFVMRKAKPLTRKPRCIPPGTTKPAKCRAARSAAGFSRGEACAPVAGRGSRRRAARST